MARVGRLGKAIRKLLLADLTLAIACFRERRWREVVVTDNERVGLMLACLLRLSRRRGAVRHVMIAHRLSKPSKLRVHRLLRLRERIDRVIVYASSQRDVATTMLGYPPDRVVLTPFMVDTEFWAPDAVSPSSPRSRPMICVVGQELRDYLTLAAAVRNLDVDVVIAAASPWSKRSDDTENPAQLHNVEVVRLNQFDLRQLYADAAFTVIPIVDTDFQAGITSILESMAMQRAVICTRTQGQTDTVRDDETGRYVSPGDAGELRRAIVSLLGDHESAARASVSLAEGGRKTTPTSRSTRQTWLKWWPRCAHSVVHLTPFVHG